MTRPQPSGPSAVGSDQPGASEETDSAAHLRALAGELTISRPIALVGMMGAGKTAVGKRLAVVLGLPFRDADSEIENAASMSIPEIFEKHGEPEFRRGERKVIARLLTNEGPHILATGGGAFMDEGTRALMRERAVSVWLKADLDTLLRRVERREGRPLLKHGDPRATLERLINERYPTYAQADVTVHSGHGPHSATLEAVLKALRPIFAKSSDEA